MSHVRKELSKGWIADVRLFVSECDTSAEDGVSFRNEETVYKGGIIIIIIIIINFK
jgi:uncharacterized Zn finger protein